jgi:DNA-binding MarR family transcriptional regulator
MSRIKRNVPINELETYRQQQPFAKLLIRTHRHMQTGTNTKLEALGYSGFSGSQGTLLAQLDPDGTRLTTLAQRLGITKQSVGQLVGDLETSGYVQRLEDPNDRRASLVRFTERGWRFCQDANRVRLELEAEYEMALGADAMRTLRDLLEQLLERADNPGDEGSA